MHLLVSFFKRCFIMLLTLILFHPIWFLAICIFDISFLVICILNLSIIASLNQ